MRRSSDYRYFSPTKFCTFICVSRYVTLPWCRCMVYEAGSCDDFETGDEESDLSGIPRIHLRNGSCSRFPRFYQFYQLCELHRSLISLCNGKFVTLRAYSVDHHRHPPGGFTAGAHSGSTTTAFPHGDVVCRVASVVCTGFKLFQTSFLRLYTLNGLIWRWHVDPWPSSICSESKR